ncbi:cytidine deaminase [Pseudoalteromonas sp. YIC-656]|uniref:cytidine deaminase n=1 Tax=Pseudoalteromonas pernae TaxID=3118054 RepID=UPI003242FB3B
MSQSTLLEAIERQRGIITSAQFTQLANELNTDAATTASWLLDQFKRWAVAPISDFHVAALVHANNHHGEDFYALGVNVEIAHFGLESAVHAEQTALHNAWLNGAVELKHIYINAAPCGYCRQFMNEFVSGATLPVSIASTHTTLSELLPHAFGPIDLGVTESIFANVMMADVVAAGGESKASLRLHQQASYAPYSGGQAAVEITYSGVSFFGRYIENAAFNPSFNPFLAALSQIALCGQGIDFDKIEAVALLESDSLKSHKDVIRTMVQRLAPNASFECA